MKGSSCEPRRVTCSRTSPEAILGSHSCFCSADPDLTSEPIVYIWACAAAALHPARWISSSTVVAISNPWPPPPYFSGTKIDRYPAACEHMGSLLAHAPWTVQIGCSERERDNEGLNHGASPAAHPQMLSGISPPPSQGLANTSHHTLSTVHAQTPALPQAPPPMAAAQPSSDQPRSPAHGVSAGQRGCTCRGLLSSSGAAGLSDRGAGRKLADARRKPRRPRAARRRGGRSRTQVWRSPWRWLDLRRPSDPAPPATTHRTLTLSGKEGR